VLWLGASLVFVSIHFKGDLMNLFARMFHRHYFYLCKKVAIFFPPVRCSKTASALQCNASSTRATPPPLHKKGAKRWWKMTENLINAFFFMPHQKKILSLAYTHTRTHQKAQRDGER
jgi:hypothetical protein